MQGVVVRGWARESQVSAEMLDSLCELNQRFLDLAVYRGAWNSSQRTSWTSGAVAEMTQLSSEQRRAAAGCPYALFDLRFHDDAFWRTRLLTADRRIADDFSGDDEAESFVRLALFYAWHVATVGKLASRLLLGMSEFTASAFRSVTIDCLPSLASVTVSSLTARWNHCGVYWLALARAAARPNATHLRRIQLYGLQLAATADWP